jgi:hypothetical protein
VGVKIPITAEMEDGRVLRAVVDQRDLARVEAQEIGSDQRVTWVRFLAFAALSRGKQYSGTWESFNETDCVEAIDGAEGPAGTDEGLDPGHAAPVAGS